MKLSVVIPAHNEEATVGETVEGIVSTLTGEGIDHEVIVVDDSSTDGTAAVVGESRRHPQVRCLPSPFRNGFGFAVRAGLDAFEGDAVAIVMADGSDSPTTWSPISASWRKDTSAHSAPASCAAPG